MGVMGLTCLIKLVRFLYLINICCFYTTSVVHMLVSIFQFTAFILDFQNGGYPPPWIFVFSQYLSRNQIIAYLYVDVQNLVKIGRSAAKLLHIFDFEYDGRPPSWICYDVIADHLRFVFDGPNILLKFHVGRIYTLADICDS